MMSVILLKKAILILVISIFSASAFAAPAPGGGGSSRPEPARKSRPAQKKAGKNNESAKPSDRIGNSKPKQSVEEKKSIEQSENLPKSDEKAAAQINADDILYYRGNRTLVEQGAFSVQGIKTERATKNEVNVEILFSQSINPRSLSQDSILVDGAAISKKTNFSFNKKGDTIKIKIPMKNKTFSLTVQNVESFDGTVIEPIIIKNLSDISGGTQ